MSENEVRSEYHNKETLRKANLYFFSKVAVNAFLIVVGTMIIWLFLRSIQSQASLARQKENSNLALDEALAILERNEDSSVELTNIYHDENQQILNDIKLVLDNGLSDSMMDATDEIRAEILATLAERAGIRYLYVLTDGGIVATGPDMSEQGRNPAVNGTLTQENINLLLRGTTGEDGTVTPVLVRNTSGTYYFYSRPHMFAGSEYMLVIGVDSGMLDVQTSALTDVSNVLSRASVVNNGFLFAVNKEDNLFLYFKNGNDLLTGQNALDSGLSKEALADGYSGVQTINGQQYYCVSRTFGDRAVICASARTDDILEDDHYVLFWTILSFNIIMLLCLVFAVIVRNDFVKRAVTTDRVILNSDSKNPIFFDKSVFRKVFPLMLTGVMVLFGISFYTQTLLEVTQGIEKSKAALQEVSGRYEESLETREIIRNYHLNHFLSTARLISFIIEEDPVLLNEESDRYYTRYDENGAKEFLPDDEGNRLKSVSNSEILQQLCDANDLHAIYVFDEEGHTIATNTSNWFFTLSRNAEDQSYPFREVLDGKTESLVQELMVNDLGQEAQFIGVSSRYFTKLDENGNTVYTSRYEFEKSALNSGKNGSVTGDGITEHSALLQIELDQELSGKLLQSTDTASILSTSMLSGGAIVMFDTTSDHLCLFSPKESSVGRTALELGISENAFTGDDYYGFNRINGINYFQYFRYLEGYYIATAIPKSSMYLFRDEIAIVTSVIGFALILILSLTVTLTNKEEEELYEAVSSDTEARGLNSAIFSIILPSGRSTVTTQAAARWDNRRISWSEKSPEQRLIDMIGFIMLTLMVYVLYRAGRYASGSNESSVINYIIGGNWDREWNVFALSACAIVLMATVIVVTLFRIPVRIITSLLGTRGETLGHLLLSVLKYGGTIGAIFYCLYLLGMDARNLLAGAGVLSLVIGLGAQSLIKDILAGIFIVFEGEFRVGDIVTISDFRGTVLDIGLRTTKIIGAAGNIKIFNNSDISGVLNMTKETSVASATISIEYGQDIEYVEAVLNRELPKLRNKNKDMLDGPQLLGITALGDSGISMTVIAWCTEQNVRGMNRFLNRELLQIFYRNGINVPFPNITVSKLDMEGRKTMEDYEREMKEQEADGK